MLGPSHPALVFMTIPGSGGILDILSSYLPGGPIKSHRDLHTFHLILLVLFFFSSTAGSSALATQLNCSFWEANHTVSCT